MSGSPEKLSAEQIARIRSGDALDDAYREARRRGLDSELAFADAAASTTKQLLAHIDALQAENEDLRTALTTGELAALRKVRDAARAVISEYRQDRLPDAAGAWAMLRDALSESSR